MAELADAADSKICRTLRPSHEPETSGQQQAWRRLEDAADRLIATSAKPISREAAIDRILKHFPDIAAEYYAFRASRETVRAGGVPGDARGQDPLGVVAGVPSQRR